MSQGNPGLAQQWREAIVEMRPQPGQTGCFVDLRQAKTHGILAQVPSRSHLDGAFHARQFRRFGTLWQSPNDRI